MQELINRARVLAKLREKATPGPWTVREDDPWDVHATVPFEDGQTQVAETVPAKGVVSHVVCSDDAKLIAASPEMAELLGEMANKLEHLND